MKKHIKVLFSCPWSIKSYLPWIEYIFPKFGFSCKLILCIFGQILWSKIFFKRQWHFSPNQYTKIENKLCRRHRCKWNKKWFQLRLSLFFYFNFSTVDWLISLLTKSKHDLRLLADLHELYDDCSLF